MMKVLYVEIVDNLEKGDYIHITTPENETYEGEVLGFDSPDPDFVSIRLANEADYGDIVEIDVPWDWECSVLAQNYDDVEV